MLLIERLALSGKATIKTAVTGAQIKRMEMEARSFSPDRSRVLLAKVKEYKADLAALRADAKKVRH